MTNEREKFAVQPFPKKKGQRNGWPKRNVPDVHFDMLSFFIESLAIFSDITWTSILSA
jgi:hypothetical protein